MGQIFVPIFPLPDLTFFPHTVLPLHVFEARYRAMVTDCLARDKRLAVVGLKPGFEPSYDGKPPVHDVAGMGGVIRWERLATGRYNILLRGEARVRIDRELPSDTLYRMVAATPLGACSAIRWLRPWCRTLRRGSACSRSSTSSGGSTCWPRLSTISTRS